MVGHVSPPDDPSISAWNVETLVHAYAQRPDGNLVDIRGVHPPNTADNLAERFTMSTYTLPDKIVAAAAAKLTSQRSPHVALPIV